MSIFSRGRAEVEEQHHVSSSPMQTEPGPSLQKRANGATSQPINKDFLLLHSGQGGGRGKLKPTETDWCKHRCGRKPSRTSKAVRRVVADGNGLFCRSTYFWIVCSAEWNGNRSRLLAGIFHISRAYFVRRNQLSPCSIIAGSAGLAILRCGLGGWCCWGSILEWLPTAKIGLTLPQSRSSCSAAGRSALTISQMIFTSCEENFRAQLGIWDCLEGIGICIRGRNGGVCQILSFEGIRVICNNTAGKDQ